MVAQQRPVTTLGNNHWCARAQPSIYMYVRVPNPRRNNLGKIQWAVSLFPVSVEHVRGDYSVHVDYPNDRTHTGCTFSSSPAPSPPPMVPSGSAVRQGMSSKDAALVGPAWQGPEPVAWIIGTRPFVLSEEKLRAPMKGGCHEGAP